MRYSCLVQYCQDGSQMGLCINCKPNDLAHLQHPRRHPVPMCSRGQPDSTCFVCVCVYMRGVWLWCGVCVLASKQQISLPINSRHSMEPPSAAECGHLNGLWQGYWTFLCVGCDFSFLWGASWLTFTAAGNPTWRVSHQCLCFFHFCSVSRRFDCSSFSTVFVTSWCSVKCPSALKNAWLTVATFPTCVQSIGYAWDDFTSLKNPTKFGPGRVWNSELLCHLGVTRLLTYLFVGWSVSPGDPKFDCLHWSLWPWTSSLTLLCTVLWSSATSVSQDCTEAWTYTDKKAWECFLGLRDY